MQINPCLYCCKITYYMYFYFMTDKYLRNRLNSKTG